MYKQVRDQRLDYILPIMKHLAIAIYGYIISEKSYVVATW